tara:strand:+ start:116 stop:1351 length:1236 start_codon:yes stop_codon:yes gene_type:complete
MKKTSRLKKIVKWVSIVIGAFFMIMLWSPMEGKYEGTGKRLFGWSGWTALFDNTDFSLKFNYYPKVEFNGIDGPYVVSDKIYNVNSENKLIATNISKDDSIQVRVNNKDSDKFYFKIRNEYSIEKSEYKMPEKLIAISDIEGNFDGFSGFLKKNGIIDSNFNWIFKNGHLVLVGDFVDRGNSVTQVLWLIYKLEKQAKKNGGKVHFILGNHEIMNFQGNGGYNQEKYIKVAQEISKKEEWEKAIQLMFSDNTELGNWLRTKNVIKKIGDYIFVHAGLHPELLDYKVDLDKINRITRKNWDKDLYRNPKDDETANFLIGRISPIWYRGLVTDSKYYDKINEVDLNKVLEYYNAKKIIVGHTVVRNISTGFNGKVIRVDLKHGIEKNSGFTKGLLIENGIEYIIDDNGNKETL